MSVRLLDELFGYRGLLPFSWLFGRCHASLFRCVLENFHSTRHIDGRWAYAGAIAALDAFERSGEYGLCNAVRFIMRIEVAHGYLHHGARPHKIPIVSLGQSRTRFVAAHALTA